MIRTTDGSGQYKRLAGVGDKIPVLGISPTVITYTATGGETSINLSAQTPPISYKPGQHQLKVRRSSGGGELFAGIDYTETSTTAIGFAAGDALIAGEIVEIELKFAATGVMAISPRPDCYSTTATVGQTLVAADFSWTYNTNPSKAIGAVKVYVQGFLWKRGVEYTEVNLGTSMTNQILVADGFLGGEDIAILPAYQAIDDAGASTQFNNSRLTGMQSMISAGTQAFVDQSTDMIAVPNTTIVGRARIPNLANDLRASLGVERIMTQSIMQLQNEFGASGEPVYSLLNDDRGLIRFVGPNWYMGNNAYGCYVESTVSNEYMEITFYGTGINITTPLINNVDWRVSVDGAAEGGQLFSIIHSTVLASRGYASNKVISIVSGLAMGLHTVKVRLNSGGTIVASGFEILNQPWATANTNSTTAVTLTNLTGIPSALSSGVPVYGPGIPAGTTVVSLVGSALTLSQAATATATGVTLTFGANVVNPGTAYANGSKIVKSAASAVAYNAGVTGTKGGRVVRYLNSDGTAGQAFQAVDAVGSTTLANVNHANEEVVRTYYLREFGCGRTDDFSTLTSSVSDRAFTLDDGTTSLVGYQVAVPAASQGYLDMWTNGSFASITFVGTGIDISRSSSGTSGTYTMTYYIDGTLIGTETGNHSSAPKTLKIVSGLPYGTHTLKAVRTASLVNDPYVGIFTVYQPKKPTIPATAAELCDYNVVGDWSVATAGIDTVAGGVLRKMTVVRESVFVGTWATLSLSVANDTGGWSTNTSTAGNTQSYTFFGTGFDFRPLATGANVMTIAVDGSTNLSAYTAGSGVYGSGIAFSSMNPCTISQTVATNGYGGYIRGLPLGLHTVVFTKSSGGGGMGIDALDIITPIHAVKSNIYADIQNTLPVGSCSLTDSRKTSMVKEILPAQKAWAQAVGVTSGPTTTSTTYVPVPDMSVTLKTNGGPLDIKFIASIDATAVSGVNWSLYVDGISVSNKNINSYATGYEHLISDFVTVPVAAGFHKIDVYGFITSGTLTFYSTKRTLTVQEL